ncbi:ABC transporter permease [Corynebacterium glutamicum]|uniref:ABC transporter permease n=1 Tax=Corynebacterium glutamicum TaxID=1718 RepID=UPI00058A6381|nr:ABC transporter permease [Corynebacterium glutamicum]AJE66425.1 ABC transporter permease [Corynebacterium glutamicum]OKX93068.1 ABC transporter permease [Corynebacterium glutamicum]TWS33451.1 ABC transporter permease [Corynebacterium glutamicum]
MFQKPQKTTADQFLGDKSAIIVDSSNLHPLHSRPKFNIYLAQIWNRRHFIFADARGRSFESPRDMLLGRLWLVLSPLLDVAMYGLLFGLLLKTSRGVENFIGFLIIGVIFFGFIQGGLTTGSGMIKESRSMIAAFSFPRASIPIARIARQFLNNSLPALVALIAALAFQWGTPPGWEMLLVLPIYVLIHIFGLGLALIVARLTAFFPDLKSLIPVAGRAWFYVSGVFFSIERFATNPTIQEIMILNPAYRFIQAVRSVVLYQTIPPYDTWLILCAWSFGLVAIGLIYFWQAEERYVNVR